MKTFIVIALLAFAGVMSYIAPGIAEIELHTAEMLKYPVQHIEQGVKGVASYYDYVLDTGWSSVGHYVCATRDFERYSYVTVTDLDTGKSVNCKVTDYGPDEAIHPDRVVDLSSTAFIALKSSELGVINNVRVTKWRRLN